MIQRTLTLRGAIVVVVVFGLLIPALFISGYSWFQRYDQDIQKRTQELLQQNADVLSKSMNDPLWNIDAENGKALVDAMMSRNEDIVRIEVHDAALGVFVKDERPDRRIGYTAAMERPVVYRGSTIGTVQIEVGSSRLRRTLLEGIEQQAIALLAQMVLSIALILILLDRRLVQPLQTLGKGAERLAERELHIPFTWKRLDEIGLLSRRLEATRLSLRTLFDELDQKNNRLELDIDKRKRVEHELHEREARFRALVEQSPIAIIEWDSSYRVIEWNSAAERIFGYTRQQAIGRHGSFINPALASDASQIADPRQDGSVDGRNIEKNIRADGQIIVCQWSNASIDDESGHTGRVLSMAEDITEKRLAEDAQRFSEAKFAGAFQCNPDSISITRFSDGVFLDVNQTFEKTTGYTRNEWVGKNAVQLRIWEYPEENDVLIGQLNMHRMVRDFSWNMRTKQGAIRNCLTNATIFTVGMELYMLAVIRDVTDQRVMEEQKAEGDRALLRLAQGTQKEAGESFFDLLVADLASALRTDRAFIGMRDPVHPDQITTIAAHANGQHVDNFSYQIAGAPCEFTLEGDICVFSNRLRDAFPRHASLSQGGWESYAGAPIRDVDGNAIGVLAVMHRQPLGNPDLVKSLLQVFSERVSAELDRKKAEQAILELNANLEQRVRKRTTELEQANAELASAVATLNVAQDELVRSEKLAALGSLVAGIAHELNTPIGNSLMVASTLMDQTRILTTGFAEGQGLKRSVLEGYLGDASKAGDILVRNLHRAANLVSSFKQVAVDQTSSQRRNFVLREVISEIMLTLWPTLKKTSFVFEQNIPDNLVLDSFPGPLGQVVTNLINNALLHGFESRATGTVVLSAHDDGDDIELSVSDDGNGIPPTNLNRIFDPFFTTKLGAGGSGLGLNITHNIVSGILGGRIRVHSEMGQGATFILSIPKVAPQLLSEKDTISLRKVL